MPEFKGKGIIQTLQEDLFREWQDDLNKPSPIFDAFAREREFLYGKADSHPEATKLVKPVRNEDGSIGSITYDKSSKAYEYDNVHVQPINTIGAPMNEVTYGRLVRIPVANPREGSYQYEDVTVKTAKKRAKAARKLARQIEKACR